MLWGGWELKWKYRPIWVYSALLALRARLPAGQMLVGQQGTVRQNRRVKKLGKESHHGSFENCHCHD
jgi:hypothetical protein